MPTSDLLQYASGPLAPEYSAKYGWHPRFKGNVAFGTQQARILQG